MLEISVVMSIYKEPLTWVNQAIDSILNQSFKGFEFIIVNDNPLDSELCSFLEYKKNFDDRIILLTNEDNIGLTKSLNKAVEIARGKYLARMDADDISRVDRLKKQYTFLELHADVDICGGNISRFGDISCISVVNKQRPLDHESICETLLFENPIAHPTVMMRKNIRGKDVLYNEKFRKAQDYILWFDLYSFGAKFSNLKDVLLDYRVSSNQVTQNSSMEHISVANHIYEGILKKMNVNVSNDQLRIHTEICKCVKSGITIDAKLAYLNYLYNNIIDRVVDKKRFKSNIIRFGIATCTLYNVKYRIKDLSFCNIYDIIRYYHHRIISRFFNF